MENNIEYAISDVYLRGGDGGIELARAVIKNIEENSNKKISYTYELNETPREKIERIARKVYGASSVNFSDEAEKDLKIIEKYQFNDFYICMAKTQSSISDNPALLNSPENFDINIRKILINSGSRFLIPVLGNIMTMPGLPKKPAAENIDIDGNGNIIGLK